ncbi:hypothetical protein AB3S75_025062 [Citrus x aurantiifolia]
MLQLSCNLHRPSQPLLLPRHYLSPISFPINHVKFNVNKEFVKITKIWTAIGAKKGGDRSSEEGANSEKWVHEGFITESLPNERDGGGRFLGRQTVGRGEQRALSLNIWESENSIGNSNKNLQVLTGGLCYLVV